MKQFLLFAFAFITISVVAQTTATKKQVTISGVSVVDPMQKPTSFAPLLKNLEAPTPGGDSYKNFMNSQKEKSAILYPAKNNRNATIDFGQSPDPEVIDEMNMRSYIAQIDKEGIYFGGTPLDNTMCLGKDFMLASVNSFLWAYDITGDSNLFVDENGSTFNISFAEFGKDYIVDPGVEFPFDPKLVYVPQHDKYIFIFLSGRTPTDSKIIVGFSSTNDPRDPWNVYMLPGNPRGLDQWTDFPMFGFDDKDMYLSINLLKANTSWQLGFEGSIVWQVPMDEGFSGSQNLNTTMYDDILYKGTNIRNLTPVQPGDSITQTESGITFLSNRNFDLQNDSLFIVEISENKELTVSTQTLSQPYGMPPNGIQADDNPSDLTDGLQTNDARFLGATKYVNSASERYIEFVGNTKDFNSGRAAIYHGVLKTDASTISEVQSNIIGVDSLDFGYPNIAYVNNGQGCYEGTLIAFNHTDFTTNAGVSAIRHSNSLGESGYSNIIRLKEGDGHVRRLSGSYERWGDYFGIQSVPGHPNEVYTAGFYGTSTNSSSTWFNRIKVTEDTQLSSTTSVNRDPYIYSTAEIEVIPTGGYEPYSYQWLNGSTESVNVINTSTNSSQTVNVTDVKGCVVNGDLSIGTENLDPTLYPNPVVDQLNVFFEMNDETVGSFLIYDMVGKLVANLGDLKILPGNNQFTMSTRPLLKGSYVLIIKDADDNTLSQNSFIKL